MNAVNSELSYVQGCSCGCRPVVYQTMWDLLCNQLFAQLIPPGFDSQSNFQDVRIWSEGEVEITMTGTTSPYTFSVKVAGETTPKVNDVILFGKNNFYIIGSVSAGSAANTYTCSGCLAIDVSIVGVFAALMALNAQASEAESGRVTAENGRVSAENGRVEAESGRVEAESTRAEDFAVTQAERSLAYQTAEGTQAGSVASDGSRWGAFKAAENERDLRLANYVVSVIAPWEVPGALTEELEFISDDEEDTPAEAKARWDNGQSTYLTNRTGRTEAIVAADEDYLYTASGWKWRYTEEDEEDEENNNE